MEDITAAQEFRSRLWPAAFKPTADWNPPALVRGTFPPKRKTTWKNSTIDVKLSGEERADPRELLADRPAWFVDQVRSDIAADERDDTPCAGLNTHALIRLEFQLGIM